MALVSALTRQSPDQDLPGDGEEGWDFWDGKTSFQEMLGSMFPPT